MPAQWLSLLAISLIIIASNVRTSYSECYISKNISTSLEYYPELKNCLNMTEINCDKDSSELPTKDLFDISGNENDGQEKLQFGHLPWGRGQNYALFNTSLYNVWCKKLTIRIQDLETKASPTCHTLDFDRTRNLTMSLVTIAVLKHNMRVEFFIEADGETKFREYMLTSPNSETNKLHGVMPDYIFTYMDMSDSAKVRLYIQPLDESFNVTTYNGTIKCVNEIMGNFTLSTEKLYYDWKTSDGKNGSCHFEIKPIIDPSKCSSRGCTTSSAYFDLHINDPRLIVMIVSFWSIAFAVFIALRWTYIYYARRIWSRRERPNCLLVYSSTHKEHIEVMIKLAEYLRACDINAMIDELDASKEKLHNPYLWYNKAFEKATTVIVSASPPNTGDWPSPYRFLDKVALNLIEINFHLEKKLRKNYIAIKFPHCERCEDVPLEARSFDSFKLPKDLDKLVERIQKIDYTKIRRIPKGEFLDSLNTAREKICNKRRKTSVESSSQNVIGSEPLPVDEKPYSSEETIDVYDYSTDDDGTWLGKKEDKEEAEIVEDEEDDGSVLW